jgi:Asp-tRNA(Asn)/Glu-tRNA(Gln) amidotransferase A subunit family amidase
VGFKPSYNRISIEGVIPYSISADHVGFFCNDPSGIGTVMSVLCDGWESAIENPPLQDAVLGIPEGPYLNRATDNGRAFFEAQIKRLETDGCKIRYIQTFDDFDVLERKHRQLIAAEMAQYHAPWFEVNRKLYRPQTRQQIENGLLIKHQGIEELRKERQCLRDRIEQQMRSEGIHCWVCPSATDHAPEGIQSTGDAVMNLPWTSAGLPVVTIPAGKDSFGLPQGVQIAGYFMEDECLIPIAEKIYSILNVK